MRLVVDTNILISELTRKRGRELITHPSLELYIALDGLGRNSS